MPIADMRYITAPIDDRRVTPAAGVPMDVTNHRRQLMSTWDHVA
jgi:hypothetical protein